MASGSVPKGTSLDRPKVLVTEQARAPARKPTYIRENIHPPAPPSHSRQSPALFPFSLEVESLELGGEPGAVADEVPTKTKPRSTLLYAALTMVLVAAGVTAAILLVPLYVWVCVMEAGGVGGGWGGGGGGGGGGAVYL